MVGEPSHIRGRGTGLNPKNRFEELDVEVERENDLPGSPCAGPATRFYRDASKSILVENDSPDIPFTFSVNPYRGCEHGCVYCYARPYHEYVGFSAGLDFESKILVKEDAPRLLRAELMKPAWRPQTINMSGVTDCYQPIERTLRLTRGCLEVLRDFRNPVGIVTKSSLVVRDADLLSELAGFGAALVAVTLTTLQDDLAAKMEPRAATPKKRLEAIACLAAAGIPTHVMVSPVVPGLNDHEIPALLTAAYDAGARSASHIPVRLPHGVKDLFEQWLEDHFPAAKAKVLRRIRSMHGGRLNDPRFGSRFRGEGVFADEIESLFQVARHRAGFAADPVSLSVAAFRRPGPRQGTLFAS